LNYTLLLGKLYSIYSTGSLSLYAITNKTNKNIQRPHVFLYFSAAGTIAGAVIGSLIVIGIIVSVIVYCAKKSYLLLRMMAMNTR
jgi:hypothetical protein